MIATAAEKVRLVWACLTVGGVFLFSMLSFHFLSMFIGEQRARSHSLWWLTHVTEWFQNAGRHRKAEGHADGKKAEG